MHAVERERGGESLHGGRTPSSVTYRARSDTRHDNLPEGYVRPREISTRCVSTASRWSSGSPGVLAGRAVELAALDHLLDEARSASRGWRSSRPSPQCRQVRPARDLRRPAPRYRDRAGGPLRGVRAEPGVRPRGPARRHGRPGDLLGRGGRAPAAVVAGGAGRAAARGRSCSRWTTPSGWTGPPRRHSGSPCGGCGPTACSACSPGDRSPTRSRPRSSPGRRPCCGPVRWTRPPSTASRGPCVAGSWPRTSSSG